MAYARKRSYGGSRRGTGGARRGYAARRKPATRARRTGGGQTIRLVVETSPAGQYSRNAPVLAKLNPMPGKAKF